MRVSENMRVAGASSAQRQLASRLEKASVVAARGEKVTAPSDDPVAYAARVSGDHASTMNDRRFELATRVSVEMEMAEGVLSVGVDLLAQARATAVAGSNDTLDAGTRALLAQEVTALHTRMLGVANSRFGNKYLFAGSKTDAPPFELSGAFVGDDVVTRVSLMDGVAPPGNVSGARAFTQAGGRDVLGDLKTLADALAANDVAGIRASIDAVDASHTQLVRAQTEAGFGIERFRSAIDVMDSARIVMAKTRANDVEGDSLAHFTELTLAKSAYERGVGVTRQLLSLLSLSRQ